MRIRIIIFFLFLLSNIQLVGRHIVGGDVTCTVTRVDIDNNTITYLVSINVYRDCFQQGISMPTTFDDAASVGIHRQNGNAWDFVDQLFVDPRFSTGVAVPVNGGPCIEVPPGLCVDRNEYNFEITLPVSDQSYLVSYQRCCRNETINNIIDPGGTGIAYTYEITAFAQEEAIAGTANNSPEFTNFPPILICSGQPFVFDHSATDADGDQLVYEFCSPVTAGGQNTMNPTLCSGTTPSPRDCRPPFDLVSYRLPTYSPRNPIPGDPDFTLDPNTGRLQGTPLTTGQFVVGICVKEFRNGKLIGTVNRDIQLNVTLCENTVFAAIQSDTAITAQEFVLNSCGENTVDFINESFNEAFILGYNWAFDIDGELRTATTRDASFTFPDTGRYSGVMVVNPGTECSDTAFINVNILPDLDADFFFEYDTCIAGPVIFDASPSQTEGDFFVGWDWDFGDENGGSVERVQHMYDVPGMRNISLQVTDNNGCQDTETKVINWSPVPQLIVVEPSTFIGCLPANVRFNNLTTPIDTNYFIEWDFGDGNFSNDISPVHAYETEGLYSVAVEIESPFGCGISRTFPSWIRVEEKPTAAFSYNPQFPNVFNPSVQFTDESIEAISWQWNFNNESSAFDPNPNYTFQDTGIHFVDLVVTHISGCTDTFTQIIDIRPESRFFMPNAFTPNADAVNDKFLGTGYIEGISDFNMTIWSRWGEKVFETDDPTSGWNGRKNNTGNELPNDVYVYLVTYKDPRNQEQKLKGFATLVR